MIVVGSRRVGDGVPIIPLVLLAGSGEYASGSAKLLFSFWFDDGGKMAPLRPLAVNVVLVDVAFQFSQTGND